MIAAFEDDAGYRSKVIDVGDLAPCQVAPAGGRASGDSCDHLRLGEIGRVDFDAESRTLRHGKPSVAAPPITVIHSRRVIMVLAPACVPRGNTPTKMPSVGLMLAKSHRSRSCGVGGGESGGQQPRHSSTDISRWLSGRIFEPAACDRERDLQRAVSAVPSQRRDSTRKPPAHGYLRSVRTSTGSSVDPPLPQPQPSSLRHVRAVRVVSKEGHAFTRFQRGPCAGPRRRRHTNMA